MVKVDGRYKSSAWHKSISADLGIAREVFLRNESNDPSSRAVAENREVDVVGVRVVLKALANGFLRSMCLLQAQHGASSE